MYISMKCTFGERIPKALSKKAIYQRWNISTCPSCFLGSERIYRGCQRTKYILQRTAFINICSPDVHWKKVMLIWATVQSEQLEHHMLMLQNEQTEGQWHKCRYNKKGKGKALPAVQHYNIIANSYSEFLTEVEFVWGIDIMWRWPWTQHRGKIHSLQSKAWSRDDGWWAMDSPLAWTRILDTEGDTLQTGYHSDSTHWCTWYKISPVYDEKTDTAANSCWI